MPLIGERTKVSYLKKIQFQTEGTEAVLYVTDEAQIAETLRTEGEAVLIYLHSGNSGQDFSNYLFAVEDPEELELEYIERVYRRLKGLPWYIMNTDRCRIRETKPEDVEAFYRIYSDPSITKYMENLYPEKEEEKQYIREYIDKIYTYYGYGIWTVIEHQSGEIIGRAGFSNREGFEDPELGFIIGTPWQRKGYAMEVCQGVLRYGWTALDFSQVQVLVAPGNIPSLRLCEKLGFRYEKNVILKEGEYCQLILQRQ